MKHLASLLPLPALLLAACNEVETGRYGLVEFVPDDCGAAFCDLDDRLAVDATIDITINGADGQYVDDLFIRTSAPWIAEVVDERDDGLSPRVTLAGNAPGPVDLLAVDRWGYVVDYVSFEVAAPDTLLIDVWGSAPDSIDGPHPSADTDDLYFVDADTEIEIDVSAMFEGTELTGKKAYSVVIDADLVFGLEAGEDLADGNFRLRAPAGEHDLYVATSSAYRLVHFSVK
jgi:hypothetical protein